MRQPTNIQELSNLDIDWIGHIFYPQSSRYIPLDATISPENYSNKKKIGVFVDEDLTTVLDTIESQNLYGVQLHGDESVDYVRDLRNEFDGVIMKVFGVKDEINNEEISNYEEFVDYFLFDTKTPKKGGSGLAFDWEALRNYDGEVPFILGGGLSLELVDEIKKFKHPKLAGYDLNSRFEIEPGVKDVKKIKQFIDELHN